MFSLLYYPGILVRQRRFVKQIFRFTKTGNKILQTGAILSDGFSVRVFLFVLHPQLLLLLGLGGQGAGADGDCQKGQKAQRIAGEGEVEGQIRVCKHVVDADDAQQ